MGSNHSAAKPQSGGRCFFARNSTSMMMPQSTTKQQHENYNENIHQQQQQQQQQQHHRKVHFMTKPQEILAQYATGNTVLSVKSLGHRIRHPLGGSMRNKRRLSPMANDKKRNSAARSTSGDPIDASDIFIYPTSVRDQNECHKCARDNRICNCNIIEPSPPTSNNNILTANNNNNINDNDQACSNNDTTTTTTNTTRCDNRSSKKSSQVNDRVSSERKQPKSVYKISIATASIDQKSNQLHLFTPKILPTQTTSQHSNNSDLLNGSKTSTVNNNNNNILNQSSSNIEAPRILPPNLNAPLATKPNTITEGSDLLPEGVVALGENLGNGKADQRKGLDDSCDMKPPLVSPITVLALNKTELLPPLDGATGLTKQHNETSAQSPIRSKRNSIKNRDSSPKQPKSTVTANKTITFNSNKSSTSSLLANCFPHKTSNNNNNKDVEPNSQQIQMATKVTAISIGSPTRRPETLTLERILDANFTANNQQTIDTMENEHIKLVESEEFKSNNIICREDNNNFDMSHDNMVMAMNQKRDIADQLTCNLSIGDSIKITSTSICISANYPKETQIMNEVCDSRAIVPNISTFTSRRKNSRLSRQARNDDDGSIIDNFQITNDNTETSTNLEYSPILSNAKSYIEEVNPEFKFEHQQERIQNEQLPSGEISVNSSTSSAPCQLESPKRSIFDGASKDEILEYLEDARERVPEALIAADDVMVINENELIVVNQLEPGSPATPISIVEASEVMKDPVAPVQTDIGTVVTSQSSPLLRQHFERIYQNASHHQQVILSSSNITIDEDITSDQQSGTNSGLESVNIIDNLATSCSPRTSYANSRSTDVTCNTIDSIDDQIGVSDTPSPGNSKEIDFALDSECFLRRSIKLTSSSPSNTSNKSTSEASNSLYYSPPPIYTSGRRNSSSEDSAQLERKNPLQMILRHQRCLNRDSLSSSSSSSNQTSGNCSAASNFYASSSLSCSSPFLAFSNITSSSSPAFNKSTATTTTTTTVTTTQSIARNEYDSQQSLDTLQGRKFGFSTLTTMAMQTNEMFDTIRAPAASVERDDSGLGAELANERVTSEFSPAKLYNVDFFQNSESRGTEHNHNKLQLNDTCKLGVIDEMDKSLAPKDSLVPSKKLVGTSSMLRFTLPPTTTSKSSSSLANVMTRSMHSHYATLSKLNSYLVNRRPTDAIIEFQCIDCDQFIDVDPVVMLNKINDIRLLLKCDSELIADGSRDNPKLHPDQMDGAYITAMSSLPLCKSCGKQRTERKEIISEFYETEFKYGRDLKIIRDEFYRPMQIAGLLSKDQINGIFLNLDELIMAHCRFFDRLGTAINEAQTMGDTNLTTVNIGKLFVESAEMLHTFESYCIRQGSAACLLARLAKEKELLRIFLRVSQMENTLLRRMNLAAFLMVPVQRVTKYPLLLNRLYKVTAYHHKDREALRDAQLKVELHLEHINQQTKGVGATNKIWRRISNLSASNSHQRRGLINAEDIGYIKLRKTALDLLKWERDETQFIHSGKVNFAPLNEYLTRQKAKPLRYMAAHALLIVLGKPNWKYRPDLVKSNLDSKLKTPTPGGTGIKEAALLLFREKNGRFVPCREPLFMSNCVLCADCSQYNSECQQNQTNHNSKSVSTTNNQQQNSTNINTTTNSNRKSLPGPVIAHKEMEIRASSVETSTSIPSSLPPSLVDTSHTKSLSSRGSETSDHGGTNSPHGDAISMSSLKSLPEDQGSLYPSPPLPTPRSYSLASALPRTPITSLSASSNLNKSSSTTPSNLTIINQLMNKVNGYHKQATNSMIKQQPNIATMSQHKTNGSDGLNANGRHQIKVNDLQVLGSNQNNNNNNNNMINSNDTNNNQQLYQHFNHHFFHNHHQPYGDYEESFEIHERLSKESLLLRADTPLKTRYWLQMLRYHAKDLGQWRMRRNGLANIMMMHQE